MPKNVSTNMGWQARSAQLTALTQWQASGKVAIRTSQSSESASMDWRQVELDSHLVLSGPMGIGSTLIDSNPNELRISRNGETHRYDVSSQAQSNDLIAWDLPLHALPYWLKGLPAPPDEHSQKDIQNGLLLHLEQLGWTITYETYGQFAQYTLPTRMIINKDDTRALLIIRNWAKFSP